MSLAQVLSGALVFRQQCPRPEEVNPVIGVLQAFDFLLEGRQQPPFLAEDGKEFVPEGLGFRAFIADTAPFPRKLYRALPYLVPG